MFNYSKCPQRMLIPCLFVQINLQHVFKMSAFATYRTHDLSHAHHWLMYALMRTDLSCAKCLSS